MNRFWMLVAVPDDQSQMTKKKYLKRRKFIARIDFSEQVCILNFRMQLRIENTSVCLSTIPRCFWNPFESQEYYSATPKKTKHENAPFFYYDKIYSFTSFALLNVLPQIYFGRSWLTIGNRDYQSHTITTKRHENVKFKSNVNGRHVIMR